MKKEEPAIVQIIKWAFVMAAGYGAAHMAYAATGAGEFSAFIGLIVLIGYAMYDTPTNTKP